MPVDAGGEDGIAPHRHRRHRVQKPADGGNQPRGATLSSATTATVTTSATAAAATATATTAAAAATAGAAAATTTAAATDAITTTATAQEARQH